MEPLPAPTPQGGQHRVEFGVVPQPGGHGGAPPPAYRRLLKRGPIPNGCRPVGSADGSTPPAQRTAVSRTSWLTRSRAYRSTAMWWMTNATAVAPVGGRGHPYPERPPWLC